MNPDETSLEADLHELSAAPLDGALMARLEAAADGTLTALSPAELRFEEQLRGISPSALDDDFIAAMEKIVRDVPFPVDEKIVLFPKAGAVRPRRSNRPTWAAAAAVALIGAATALLMPVGNPAAQIPSQPGSANTGPISTASGNFVPAGFNRGVSNIHDEGVVWKSNTQPHSLMRVEFVDKITLKDQFGREFQVEQPGARYMLVPAKTD